VTHLLDTSVLHTYARSERVRDVVDGIVSAGGMLSTCPVVIAEYCFSAQSPEMLKELTADMGLFYLLESDNLTPRIHAIQSALWSCGLVRAAGAQDTLIAAYALEHGHTVVTCDRDFAHISAALEQSGSSEALRVLTITDDETLPKSK